MISPLRNEASDPVATCFVHSKGAYFSPPQVALTAAYLEVFARYPTIHENNEHYAPLRSAEMSPPQLLGLLCAQAVAARNARCFDARALEPDHDPSVRYDVGTKLHRRAGARCEEWDAWSLAPLGLHCSNIFVATPPPSGHGMPLRWQCGDQLSASSTVYTATHGDQGMFAFVAHRTDVARPRPLPAVCTGGIAAGDDGGGHFGGGGRLGGVEGSYFASALHSPPLFQMAGAVPVEAATAAAAGVALRPQIDAPWSERVPLGEKTYVWSVDFHGAPLACNLPILVEQGAAVHAEIDFANCVYYGLCKRRLKVLSFDEWRGFSLDR